MARPKLKKDKYILRLTAAGNFHAAYYNDEEELEAEWTEPLYDNIMRHLVKHNKEKTGVDLFVLPYY